MSRATVWNLISDMRNYRRWWPWLTLFEATALAAGETWECAVRPPVPYPVRFQVALEGVHPPWLVRGRVDGDVRGWAELTLDEARSGAASVVTLRSVLVPSSVALRTVSRLAPSVARFGHDWIIDTGIRRFVARAAP